MGNIIWKYSDLINSLDKVALGFLDEFCLKNALPEFKVCGTNLNTLFPTVLDLLDQLRRRDIDSILTGIEDLGKLLRELPPDVDYCTHMAKDGPRIVAWIMPLINDFNNTIAEIIGNGIMHKDELVADAAGAALDWSFKNYPKVGTDLADCAYILYPVKPANGTLTIDFID